MAAPVRSSAMIVTVEAFMTSEHPDKKVELVRGEVRVTPGPGAPHSIATYNLVAALTSFVSPKKLGRVFGDGVSYELVRIPLTVRMPDASFVRADRFPSNGIGSGWFRFAPDLVVEVLSPSETASLLEEKLHDYMVAGTPLIWVVDPVRRTVMVMAADTPVSWLNEEDTLTGGSVMPGFTCPVADIFEGIARDSID